MLSHTVMVERLTIKAERVAERYQDQDPEFAQAVLKATERLNLALVWEGPTSLAECMNALNRVIRTRPSYPEQQGR